MYENNVSCSKISLKLLLVMRTCIIIIIIIIIIIYNNNFNNLCGTIIYNIL
jgi:hypothetical protein